MASLPSILNRIGPLFGAACEHNRRTGIFVRSEGPTLATTQRFQLQLPIPYGREPRHDERVKRQLELGWSVAQLQRLSDQEVLVTFEAPALDQP